MESTAYFYFLDLLYAALNNIYILRKGMVIDLLFFSTEERRGEVIGAYTFFVALQRDKWEEI